MSHERRAFRLLTSRCFNVIDFEVTGLPAPVRIRGENYRQIGEFIRDGRIELRMGVRTVGDSASFTSGTGSGGRDLVEVGFTSFASGSAKFSLVHECTHAIFDINRWSGVPRAHEEAIAMLVEAAFKIPAPQGYDGEPVSAAGETAHSARQANVVAGGLCKDAEDVWGEAARICNMTGLGRSVRHLTIPVSVLMPLSRMLDRDCSYRFPQPDPGQRHAFVECGVSTTPGAGVTPAQHTCLRNRAVNNFATAYPQDGLSGPPASP